MKAILKKSLFLLSAIIIATGCAITDPNIEQAKLDIKNGDYDKALTSLNTAIQNNPASSEALTMKGDILAEVAGKKADPTERLASYEEMMSSYTTAKSINDTTNKKPLNDIIDLSIQRYWAKEHNAGVKLVAVEGTPEDAAIKKSIGHFINATTIAPDSVVSFEVLSQVYSMGKDYTGAIEYMQRAIDLMNPAPMNNYLNLNAYYELNKDTEGGLEVLKKAQEVYPESIEINQALANAYLSLDDTDNALATVKQLIDRDPENAQYRLVYGTQLYTTTENMTTEMESNYELLSVLKKDIKSTKDKKTSAKLKAESDSLTKANETLKMEVDRLVELSLVQLNKVIEIQPEDAQSNFTIGVILQNKAAAIFKERDYTDDNKKAGVLDKSGKEVLNKALPYYEKAVEIKPEEKEYWMTLFRVYTTLGMTDKAQVAMEKAGL